MQSFVYSYSEEQRPKRNGHTYKTVRIYRLIRNTPRLVAERTETYVDKFQLVMMALEENKLVPAKAFERHDNGSMKYGYPDRLREAGIANINEIW